MNDKLERAQELVYEHYTGKCWHKLCDVSKSGKGQRLHCSCGSRFYVEFASLDVPMIKNIDTIDYLEYHMFAWMHGDYDNPSLATKLDDWAEHIWPVMDAKRWSNYIDELSMVDDGYSFSYGAIGKSRHQAQIKYAILATPMHHLQAALREINTPESNALADEIGRG